MIATRHLLPVLANIIIRRDSSRLMHCPQHSNVSKLANLSKFFGTGQHGQVGQPEQVEADKNSLPCHRKPCNNHGKLKSPVLENTIGYAVATSTVKRGFVTSKFCELPNFGSSMVWDGMGQSARLAARRIPCFQHPVHPPSLKTGRVGFPSRYGARSMTTVIQISDRRAAPPSLMDTTNPDVIRLHMQAENALSTALHYMRKTDFTPEMLQMATARAIRAATLLKRATQENKGSAA